MNQLTKNIILNAIEHAQHRSDIESISIYVCRQTEFEGGVTASAYINCTHGSIDVDGNEGFHVLDHFEPDNVWSGESVTAQQIYDVFAPDALELIAEKGWILHWGDTCYGYLEEVADGEEYEYGENDDT